jgi:NDP-sugar pyrophosphorylase family protein
LALGQRTLSLLPEQGCLIGDVCLPHLRRGGRITTLQHHGAWFDVGTLQGYRAANVHWLAQRAGTAPSGADSNVQCSYVAPSAQLPPAVGVRDSIVGDGARLLGEGLLERCIVWPGAAATLPLADCAVLPSGARVVLPPMRAAGQQ